MLDQARIKELRDAYRAKYDKDFPHDDRAILLVVVSGRDSLTSMPASNEQIVEDMFVFCVGYDAGIEQARSTKH